MCLNVLIKTKTHFQSLLIICLLPVDIIGDAVTIVPDCTVPYLKFKWTARGGSQDMFQPLYRCTWNSSEV